jgi:hypothetical protein
MCCQKIPGIHQTLLLQKSKQNIWFSQVIIYTCISLLGDFNRQTSNDDNFILPTKYRFILAKQFQRITCVSPCLLMDQNEMSYLYRGSSIDASYQVSVHLSKRFQRRFFFKIGHSETRIACGGHVC